ncbi:MAG: VCBS repeat-containing protein, partial [Deltaproteobacteria bacterium]|nr:VCBS repeat-containing protein [Deltaproteobacteria bacterium]
DLNRDGKLDLAVATSQSNDVLTLLGNGDGTFGSATHFPVGGSPRLVAIGDFNRDGKPDLAVVNYNDNNVSILLGTGAGSFGSATNYSSEFGPLSVAVGDFNRDGKLDLAVANSQSDSVSILLGNGDGTFGAATNFPAGSGPLSVAVGDLNGDGKPDLAVANFGDNKVSILLGNGDGTFGAATNFTVGTNLRYVSLLLGTGTGSFGVPTEFIIYGFDPYSLAIGDFNGDGRLDLAVANGGSDTVSVLLNSSGPNPTLTVTRAGTGSGTVVSYPEGIDCGTDCTKTYNPGVAMTLLAMPAAGSDFTGWSGGGCVGKGPCNLTLVVDTTVTATFTVPTFTLTVAKLGSGSGTVTSSPSGIDCGATCQADFASGEAVTLTASPASGSVFAGWNGCGTQTDTTCDVAMLTDRSITATFNLPLSIASSLPEGEVGLYYSASPASDGRDPYTVHITRGSLPAGLSFNDFSGVLFGTPSRTGAKTFTVNVTDMLGATVTGTFRLNVLKAVAITTGSLRGKVGRTYQTTIRATGGKTPYSWSLISGSLPDDLTLDEATGTISGSPIQAGTFTFTVQVRDALEATAQKTLRLVLHR